MKPLIFLIVFLTLISFVNADLQKTEIYVNEGGILNFIEDYVISEDLNIILPTDYYNFNINLDSYELNENDLVLDANGETRFEIKYSTSEFSYKDGNVWRLSVDLEGLDNNFVSVYLSENAKLLSANEGAEIYTLGGIIIIDLKSVDNLEISYELGRKESKNYLWILYIVLLILVLLFFFRKKFIKPKKLLEKVSSKKDKIEEKNDVMNTLTETESKIVKVLTENKRLTQKKILFLTGLPKSTLSRTLRSLQRKNIIEIKRVGISNVIYLKDWFKG